MILKKLSILNYKNISEAQLELSPKMNCFIGPNGAGKTNVLDVVYYLSFCRSASNPIDSQVIRHEEPFCLIEGEYEDEMRNEKGEMGNGNEKWLNERAKDISSFHHLHSSLLIAHSSFKIDLSYQEALKFLRGETLTCPPDTPRGIIEVCFDGHPLGQVKNIGTRANNLYPKPWRIKTTHIPNDYEAILRHT